MDYGDFAWFYDRYWGPDAVAWELAVLEKVLLGELPTLAAVVDVCCGAGHLARALTERRFSVTGVDASPAMIELARRNAPEARFVAMDVRELEFEQTFDAAVSMYDSLNHLLCLDDLRAAFAAVARSLTENGLFLFDLNTEAAIEAWTPVSRVDDDAAFIVQPGFDPANRRGTFAFTGFRADGPSWRRIDVLLEETWFEETEVREALLDAGFGAVASFDLAELLGSAATGEKTVYLAGRGTG